MENHVDPVVLGTLRDVMEEGYLALLEVFIKDSEQRISDLNQQLRSPGFSPASTVQLQQVGMIAHSFKGSSSNMGAVHLTDLCRELEDLVRSRPPVDDARLRQLLQSIGTEFDEVRSIFEAELQAAHPRS